LKILKGARHLGITVYDASYVLYAKKLDAALVTEDQRLRRATDGRIKDIQHRSFGYSRWRCDLTAWISG